MIETKERLDANRMSEFRQRLRDACGQRLRRMLLTDREMRELANSEHTRRGFRARRHGQSFCVPRGSRAA